MIRPTLLACVRSLSTMASKTPMEDALRSKVNTHTARCTTVLAYDGIHELMELTFVRLQTHSNQSNLKSTMILTFIRITQR